LPSIVLDPQRQSELGEAVDGLILLREVLGNASGDFGQTSTGGPTLDQKSPPPIAAPSVFRGFEYLRTLGAGSGGWVFLARDLSLPRRVAIKSPRKHDPAEGSHARPLPGSREAAAIAQLDHPGIVPIHLFDSQADPPRIVMGYCDGGSLAQWLKAHPGPHDPRFAVRVLLDLCDAVGHAHSRHIIHRDLKPGNILLSSLSGTLDVDSRETPPGTLLQRWRLKVADFGLAQRLDDLPNQDIVGTLPYMAPEQLDPQLGRADVTSDIWSLGAILFELLTGTRPHAGDTIAALQADIARHPAPSPRARNRRQAGRPIPATLDEITVRCLCVDKSERYPSVDELQTELRCFLDDRPRPDARLSDRVLHFLRQRSPRMAVASSLVTLLLLVGLRSFVNTSAPTDGKRTPPAPNPAAAISKPSSLIEQEFQQQFGRPFVHRKFPHHSPDKLGRLLMLDNLGIEDLAGRTVGALQLNSAGVCLAEFTENPGDNFEFSIALHQDQWRGNCGIFLGFQEVDPNSDPGGPRAQFLRLREETRGGTLTPLLQRLAARLPPDIEDLSVFRDEAPLDEVWIPSFGPEGAPQRMKVVVRQGRLVSISWNDREYPELVKPERDDWYESHGFPLRGPLGVWSEQSTIFYEPRFRVLAAE
jgi:serine/threonine protein kinase